MSIGNVTEYNTQIVNLKRMSTDNEILMTNQSSEMTTSSRTQDLATSGIAHLPVDWTTTTFNIPITNHYEDELVANTTAFPTNLSTKKYMMTTFGNNITFNENYTQASNWTVICDYVVYYQWYSVFVWIFFIIAFYMLLVSIAYNFEWLKPLQGQQIRTLQKFNKIIIVSWVFPTFALFINLICQAHGSNIHCRTLSAFYILEINAVIFGFATVYGCLWYRCWCMSKQLPINKLQTFIRASRFVLGSYIIIGMIALAICYASSDYSRLLRKANKLTVYFDNDIALMIPYGLCTILAQILLFFLFSYPIKAYRDQLENTNISNLTDVMKKLKTIRVIVAICIVSDILAAVLSALPAKYIGTEKEIIVVFDLIINSLLLVLAFTDWRVRFGFTFMRGIFSCNRNDSVAVENEQMQPTTSTNV